MKNLEKNQLDLLLSIIGSNPSQRIAHFTDGGTQLISALHSYCLPKEYLYQINCINNIFYENIVKEYENSNFTKVKKFPLQRKSYMTQGKQYDYIFISNSINNEDRNEFLKKVHNIILNAGNIIIFIKKDNLKERDEWTQLLEDNYFVATNTISDMFENYDIIISKKMHGWGVR
jgi:phospholipid N-methyltransferase